MKVKEIRRKLSKYGTFYFHPSFQNGLSTRVLPVPRQILRIAQPTDEDLGKKIFFFYLFRGMWIFGSRVEPAKVIFRGQRPYTKYYIRGKKEIPLRVILLTWQSAKRIMHLGEHTAHCSVQK